MILRRLGNKTKIAKMIQAHFPPHKIYIEPFFGAGGMFFNKPKAKHNILNDIDSEVFNLFQVVSLQKDALEKSFLEMPISEDLWEYWKKNKETDTIRRALRFLLLSNYGYMGKPETLRFGIENTSNVLYENLNKTHEFIFGSVFMNSDFRAMFSKVFYRHQADKKGVFIYADPPYLGTEDNYSNSFTESDSNDLFNCLQETGCKWAMSEFDHPFIIQQAKERNLNITYIGERQNMKNRRIEILVTNYKNALTLF
jgi:DNA adenine methylase